MRVFAATVFLLALALVVGCGNSDDSTPTACLEGPEAYARALTAAPDEVLLEGETLISECLVRNQSSGDLTRVGEALIETATKLNAEARADAGGDAAVQLGYLLGAVQGGSEESEGIHSDLVRRLTVAARYAPGKQPLSPAFLRAYRDGYAAGKDNG
ncbi:MAG: hypothetical protein E6G51_02825 [Actinobacteria bacterium]|nr:MAG: hypothetical protein E6G51_02825 [Actinomycetota bacterium]